MNLLIDNLSDPNPADAHGSLVQDGNVGRRRVWYSSEKIERFQQWCEERAESAKSHTYTRQSAERRFAQSKGVDREYQKRYDHFSTVWISVTRPLGEGESPVDHAKSFHGRPLSRKLRRTLKRHEWYEGHAGVKLLAPHSPESEQDAPTHLHIALWLPSRQVSESDFHRLRETDGFDIDVSVESHDSDNVETPREVLERGSELDSVRGETTALPQEVGRNLPMLQCEYDARDAHDYITRWAAVIRLGQDGQLDTRGVTRFQYTGSFQELADTEKHRVRLTRGTRIGREIGRRLI